MKNLKRVSVLFAICAIFMLPACTNVSDTEPILDPTQEVIGDVAGDTESEEEDEGSGVRTNP